MRYASSKLSMRAASSVSLSRLSRCCWFNCWSKSSWALRRFRLPAPPFQVVDGIPLGPQMRSLKTPGRNPALQLAACPLEPSPLGIAHYDKTWEVTTLTAKAVGGPGADGRGSPCEAFLCSSQTMLEVIVGFGVTRMDESHLVDMLAKIRKDRRDPFSAFAPR